MKNSFSDSGLAFLLTANALVVSALAYAWALSSYFPDFYYFSVQEDEYLEWASFWAFVLAAVVFFLAAAGYRRTSSAIPWFSLGIGVFCFVVAMEEISWGQRVLGYRPPTYFLEHNFQQEFNFHNVVDTDYRKLALTLIIAGYGILLPLAAQFGVLRNGFERVGITAPPIGLLPAFAATLLTYVIYPWGHSGEWVEFMLGVCFLFSAAILHRSYADERRLIARLAAGNIAVFAFLAVAVLGLISGAASRMQRDAHPMILQAAQSEIEAIARDFEAGLARSRCNLHKRLYTFVEDYEQTNLFNGSFSALQAQGLPEERADFFLDPWNSPYWIRDRCDRATGTRRVFVYSFGPNRRRDSGRTEILADDIGTYIESN